MKEQERQHFRQMLVELRKKLCNNVCHLEKDALKNEGHAVSELSDLPINHLADRGSDNFARDMLIGILQNSEAEICDIDLALEKIDAGTFGVCENCNSRIAKSRLKALPFARLCIKCRELEEEAQSRR